MRDLGAPYWFDDRTLAEVAIGGTEDDPLAFATAVFAPEAYDDLIRLDLPNRYRWNMFVDVDRLDAGMLDVLVPDLRRLDATFVTTGAVRPGRVLVRSGLLGLVERYLGAADDDRGRPVGRGARTAGGGGRRASDSSASSSSVAGARRWPWRAVAGPRAGSSWPRNCGRGC